MGITREATKEVDLSNRTLAPAGPYSLAERDELFASFDPLVRRLQRLYGSDPEMRQELIGEIFCRFCVLLDEFDPDKGIPVRAYLVRGLSLAIYAYVRSNWRRQRREVRFELPSGLELSGDPEPTDEQWIQRLVLEQVYEALPAEIERLPQRQRLVIVWRYYDGRSFEEIGELLGVQTSTARSLLRHGLNHLRKRLRPMDLDA